MFKLLGRWFSEEVTSPNEEKKDPLPFEQNTSLVLKNIFRHLSDADLRNARLVDRSWNLAAVSELASREYCPPPIQLHGSFEPSVGSFSWYLDFENSRRSLWTEVYGTGCPVLEFRHLHFVYPEEPDIFFSIAQSSWRDSVTSLTLSLYEFLAEELLINWFLPSFPNVQNLSCFIQADDPIETSITPMEGPNCTEDSECKQCPPAVKTDVAKPAKSSKQQGMHCRQYRKVRSFSVCFEKASSFPWTVLDSFPMLHNLKLEFGDTDALMRCADDLVASEISLRIIRSLEIILTHSDVEQQVEERELSPSSFYNRAFIMANVKLCNLFRVYKSLRIATLLSATSFFEFLRQLTNRWTTELDFEIAVPCDPYHHRYLRLFCTYLIPRMKPKFPALNDLHLRFVQFNSSVPITVGDTGKFTGSPAANLWSLEKLRISTRPANEQSIEGLQQFVALPLCQKYILSHPWLPMLAELVVEVCNPTECQYIINGAAVNCEFLKKLVLRGSSYVLEQKRVVCWTFFPNIDCPSLPNSRGFGTSKEKPLGLPRLKSLEVFCLEKFGLYYTPSVACEIRKMARLKSIELDADFNDVFSDPAVTWQNLTDLYGKKVYGWPSSVENVKILTKKTAL